MGKPEGFALDVPQGNVDPAHGVDGRTLTTIIDGAPVHLVPEPVDFERILANEDAAQPHGVAV